MYEYKRRGFKADDDSTSIDLAENDDLFFTSTKKDKKKRSHGSSSENVNKTIKTSYDGPKFPTIDDDDDDVEYLESKSSDLKQSQSGAKKTSAFGDLLTSHLVFESNKVEEQDDDSLVNYKQLLARPKAPQKPSKHTPTVTKEDPTESNIILPKVKSADERKKMLIVPTLPQSTLVKQIITENFITFKTRLNGQNELHWKISESEPFSKFRQSFCQRYGLKENEVSFTFDGFEIGDTQTPKSIEIEDDNILECTVAKPLFDKAVAYASHSSEPSLVKIKTRLNGKHMWLWKINVADPFSKFRSKFSLIYGLKENEVSFSFDGSRVEDSETPTAIGIEDHNIIDCKISTSVYEKAVENASLYKQGGEASNSSEKYEIQSNNDTSSSKNSSTSSGSNNNSSSSSSSSSSGDSFITLSLNIDTCVKKKMDFKVLPSWTIKQLVDELKKSNHLSVDEAISCSIDSEDKVRKNAILEPEVCIGDLELRGNGLILRSALIHINCNFNEIDKPLKFALNPFHTVKKFRDAVSKHLTINPRYLQFSFGEAILTSTTTTTLKMAGFVDGCTITVKRIK